MNTASTLHRLSLGTLSVLIGGTAAAADPSQWTCSTCPFDQGASGTIEAGAVVTSGRARAINDITGLDRRSGVLAGGSLRWRGADGAYADALATDLGLDSRSLAAEAGREGLFRFRIAYDELPRLFADGARTPYIGVGGTVLGLPAGFPAPNTAAMPLAATLQPVDLGYSRDRVDLGATAYTGEAWTWRIGARRDVRDGTRPGSGSFFSSASQLPIPVDQTTDLLDLSGTYSGTRTQFSVGWHASNFSNGADALTWANPFTAVAAGATRGTLALAPDNQFHQLTVSGGHELAPGLRIAADVSAGRMTQDAALLPLTTNATLAAGSLPAASLHGRASTLDASVRFSAEVTPALRVQASVTHAERDDETPVSLWPGVAADVFVTAAAVNQPYSYRQDRARLQADYRATRTLRLNAGLEHERTTRSLLDVTETREDRGWLRLTAPVLDAVALSLKLTHAERRAEPSSSTAASAVATAENALMQRYYLADRRRDAASVRADVALSDTITLGADADIGYDNYTATAVGLRDARQAGLGVDLGVAISDETQLSAWARGEQLRSRQAGSQNLSTADWSGRVLDRVETLGASLRTQAMKGRLELGADLMLVRARSQVAVDPGSATPGFPQASTARESVGLRATWRIQPNLWLVTRYAYEHWRSQDWHVDGLTPSAVENLLAFGSTAPRGQQQLLSVAVRHRF